MCAATCASSCMPARGIARTPRSHVRARGCMACAQRRAPACTLGRATRGRDGGLGAAGVPSGRRRAGRWGVLTPDGAAGRPRGHGVAALVEEDVGAAGAHLRLLHPLHLAVVVAVPPPVQGVAAVGWGQGPGRGDTHTEGQRGVDGLPWPTTPPPGCSGEREPHGAGTAWGCRMLSQCHGCPGDAATPSPVSPVLCPIADTPEMPPNSMPCPHSRSPRSPPSKPPLSPIAYPSCGVPLTPHCAPQHNPCIAPQTPRRAPCSAPPPRCHAPHHTPCSAPEPHAVPHSTPPCCSPQTPRCAPQHTLLLQPPNPMLCPTAHPLQCP